MNILIVDYGLCNIDSVVRAVKECGHTPLASEKPEDLDTADKLIIPGVGNFSQAMTNLNETGWADAIRKAALDDELPLLGICLGMQLLATRSEEGDNAAGLDLIPGEVTRLNGTGLRVPHVGWNEVAQLHNDPVFDRVDDKKDFYFVHSYHFSPSNPDTILATTPYEIDFVSVVRRKNIYGVQFHPEKSLKAGLHLLHNFLAA